MFSGGGGRGEGGTCYVHSTVITLHPCCIIKTNVTRSTGVNDQRQYCKVNASFAEIMASFVKINVLFGEGPCQFCKKNQCQFCTLKHDMKPNLNFSIDWSSPHLSPGPQVVILG